MLYTLRIRLHSPFLGDIRSNNLRKFRRSKTGKIVMDPAQLKWVLNEAALCLGYSDVVTSGIRISDYQPLRISLYKRKWSANVHRTYVNEETFEAFNSGILTLPLFVPSTLEFDTPESETERGVLPSQEQVRCMFEFVGNHLGLSPWGSKHGYGKFSVESLNAQKPEEILSNLGRRSPDSGALASNTGEDPVVQGEEP